MKARVLLVGLVTWLCGCGSAAHVEPVPAFDAGRQESPVASARDAGKPAVTVDASPRDAQTRPAADGGAARDGGGTIDAGLAMMPPSTDAASVMPPSSTDVDAGDECAERELTGDTNPIMGEQLALIMFSFSNPLGGVAEFHDSPQWGAHDASLSSLATIKLDFEGASVATERYPAPTTPDCHRYEVLRTIRLDLVSEDGLLDEHWSVPSVWDEQRGTLRVTYELDVSALQGSMRDMLAANGGSRVRFTFDSADWRARAIVFEPGHADASLRLFDWNALCKQPFASDDTSQLAAQGAAKCPALDDGLASTFTPANTTAGLDCVAQHVSDASAFDIGWSFVGGTTQISGSVMRATQELTNRGRAPFVEFIVVSGNNTARGNIRRCQSLKVTEPCNVSGNDGSNSPCIECVMPSAWLRYCGSLP